tara:strand:+ start:92 stop:829 length:738 start_codon:yes stop_codon:yes gene_type:complete
MVNVFFCDVCSKETINGKGELAVDFFSCNTKQKWQKHIQTPKHVKRCEKVKEDPSSIECKYCKKKFSQVGYAIHSNRNKSFWYMKKIGHSLTKDMICNNVVVNKHRFATFDDYKKSLENKEPSKRSKVGEVSPITNVARAPNKPYKKHKSNVSMEISACETVDEEEEKPKKKDFADGYDEITFIKSYRLTDNDLDLLDMYDNQPDNIPLDECEDCGYFINEYKDTMNISNFFFTSHLGWEVCDCA